MSVHRQDVQDPHGWGPKVTGSSWLVIMNCIAPSLEQWLLLGHCLSDADE